MSFMECIKNNEARIEGRRAKQALRYPAPNDKAASTFGWDFVFAIRYTDVNAAIAKAALPAIHFNQSETSSGRTITIDGQFGTWEVAQGGAGTLLHMRLPISTMDYSDTTGTPKTVTDLVAVIEVELEFLPQPDLATDPSEGIPHVLRLSTGPGNPVTVTDLEDPMSQLDSIENAITRGLLADWLNDGDNLQEFNHTFATVNLAAKADKKDFQWLKPVHVAYAVIDLGSLESSVFAVLCMTDREGGTPAPIPPAQQVSPYAIRDADSSGFLISYERFLAKMLLPGAGHQFDGPVEPKAGKTWPEDYFTFSESGTTMRNNAAIRIDKLEIDDDGTTVPASMPANGFTTEMLPDRIRIQYDGLTHEITASALKLTFDATHIINAEYFPRYQDEKFDLTQGDGLLFTHQTVVQPTTTTKIVSDILFWVSIALSVLPGLWKGLKWLKARSAARAAGAGGALLEESAQLAQRTGQEAADAATLGEGSAQAVSGLAKLKGLFARPMTYYYIFIIACASARGWAYIAEEMANDRAQKRKYLPKAKEFAREVMKPVSWPGAEAEYDVTNVTFNGAYQVAGNAGFAWYKG